MHLQCVVHVRACHQVIVSLKLIIIIIIIIIIAVYYNLTKRKVA